MTAHDVLVGIALIGGIALVGLTLVLTLWDKK